MNLKFLDKNGEARASELSFFRVENGLIEVSGNEAVQFLNGLITNDIKKLESGQWMAAAFPNAQGRLLAVVRVLRIDDKFLFVTDEQTRAKIFQNLFRFTFAGDFKVEDLTAKFACFSVRGSNISGLGYQIPNDNEIIKTKFENENIGYLVKSFRAAGFDALVPQESKEKFVDELKNIGAIEIDEVVQDILRIENGIPKYGVDMDETTIVPELDIDNLINYQKGCYIGQEIIARIYFRGHVAKQLTGLILEEKVESGSELKSLDGRNAGKITSLTFSPAVEKFIALAFVRYDFLAEGTELTVGETTATVKHLPFVK